MSKFPLQYGAIPETEVGRLYEPRMLFDTHGRMIMPVSPFHNIVHSVTPGSKTVRVETENAAGEGNMTSNYLNGVLVQSNVPEAFIQGYQIGTATILGSNIAIGTITGENLGDLSVNANKIEKLTITADEIADLVIVGGKIADSTITYDKLYINELSAISANLGYVTAGTLVGTIIKTAEDGYRVQMDANGLTCWGRSVIFVDVDSNSAGRIYGEDADLFIISEQDLKISATGPIAVYAEGVINWYADANGFYPRKDVLPFFDDTFDLGSPDYEWKNGYFDGVLQVDSLRIDQAPTVGTFEATHYITISCNGVSYKFPCAAV